MIRIDDYITALIGQKRSGRTLTSLLCFSPQQVS